MTPLFCGVNYYSSPPSMSILMNASMPFYVSPTSHVCLSIILLNDTGRIIVKSPIKLLYLETIFDPFMISTKITAIRCRVTLPLNSDLEKYARVPVIHYQQPLPTHPQIL